MAKKQKRIPMYHRGDKAKANVLPDQVQLWEEKGWVRTDKTDAAKGAKADGADG